jgi:hypothetical protein
MLVTRLEVPEPAATVDVKDGTFTYTSKDGQEVTADFYVRTCADDPTNPQACSKRQDDLNEQFADAWDGLRLAGNQQIHFKALYPDPFF